MTPGRKQRLDDVSPDPSTRFQRKEDTGGGEFGTYSSKHAKNGALPDSDGLGVRGDDRGGGLVEGQAVVGDLLVLEVLSELVQLGDLPGLGRIDVV
jgi:hypothetical protein